MKIKVIVRLCVAGLVVSVFLGSGSLVFCQKKTLDVAIHDAPWKPGYYAATKLFEQKFGVKVNTHVMPFNDLYTKLVTIATRGGTEFDVSEYNDGWLPFFYAGKYLWPLKEIDPTFEPDPEILTYDHINRWSFKKNYRAPDGVLYAVTFMGNLNLFWYRGDKYEEAGFSTPPATWDEVATAAKKLNDPSKPFYGYVQRGVRGNPAVFGWLPLLYSWGGDIFANPPDDWTITVNSKRAKEALEFTLKLLQWAPPGQGDISQGDIIALLATDRVLQGYSVAASFSHFDNPKESLVPFKVLPAPSPKSPYGIQGVPSGVISWGIPKGSKNKELALEFIKFFTSYEGEIEWTKNGGVSTRTDIYASKLAHQKEFRYLKAINECYKLGIVRGQPASIPEWTEIQDALGYHLNKAFVGLETADEALDNTAREIEEIMRRKKK